MRNRSRGRGKRRKPASGQPGESQGQALPPLQPMYPEDRWEGSSEFDERQPDSNAATIDFVHGGPSTGRYGGRPRRAEPQPRPRPAQPTPPQPSAAQPSAAQPAGEGGAGRRGRRRRRGRGGRGGGQRPVEAVVPGTDQSLAAALPGLAAAVPVEEQVPTGEPADEGAEPTAHAAPDLAPALQPAAPQPRQPKGVVVLAIGLPGSGKSTWFKRRGVTPLSSDLLRTILFDDITEQRYQHLVFSTLRSLLRARLIARMPWNYVDATNLSPKERRHWIQMARSFGFEAHAVFFDVPVEVCMARNARRERMVPEEAMQRMAAKLRPPKFEEGFAKITVVRVKRAAGAAAEAEPSEAEGEEPEVEEPVAQGVEPPETEPEEPETDDEEPEDE